MSDNTHYPETGDGGGKTPLGYDRVAPSHCSAECEWSSKVHGDHCPQLGCKGNPVPQEMGEDVRLLSPEAQRLLAGPAGPSPVDPQGADVVVLRKVRNDEGPLPTDVQFLNPEWCERVAVEWLRTLDHPGLSDVFYRRDDQTIASLQQQVAGLREERDAALSEEPGTPRAVLKGFHELAYRLGHPANSSHSPIQFIEDHVANLTARATAAEAERDRLRECLVKVTDDLESLSRAYQDAMHLRHHREHATVLMAKEILSRCSPAETVITEGGAK